MDAAALFRGTAARFNRHLMLPLLRRGGPVGRRLGRSTAIVDYTGRRSGRAITLAVSYQRSRDTVTIGVVAPGAKTWWRNFLGEGAPMRLTLAGETFEAHAVAVQDEGGRVRLTAALS